MTSPELPFVIPGMIWDGVTEYQNVRASWNFGPEGNLGSVVCTAMAPGALVRAGVQQAQWLICGSGQNSGDGKASASPLSSHTITVNTGFLHTMARYRTNPLTRCTMLNKFFAHASRFAHQLDAVNGTP